MDFKIIQILSARLEEEGFSTEEVLALCNILTKVKKVLSGEAEVKCFEQKNVDLETEPVINGFETIFNILGDKKFKFHPSNMTLFYPAKKVGGRVIDIDKMVSIVAEEVLKKKAFTGNAALLNFLLSNSNLIPETWRGKKVLFLGTRYIQAQNSQIIIPCLDYTGTFPVFNTVWDSGLFGEKYPVLIIR